MDPVEAGGWFTTFVQEVGLRNAIATVFFFGTHWWLYRQYNGRLDDRQAEIDRLAQDNREYRERFLAITDAEFNYDSEKKKVKKPKRSR